MSFHEVFEETSEQEAPKPYRGTIMDVELIAGGFVLLINYRQHTAYIPSNSHYGGLFGDMPGDWKTASYI